MGGKQWCPISQFSSSFAPIPHRSRPHTPTHTMADHHHEDDDGALQPPPALRPAPPVTVYGLEVGLLDVGRFVALNGYADACRLLPFLSRSFHREEDYVVACKHVKYGGKQRTRLMSLARAGDDKRVSLLLKVGADVDARDTRGSTALHIASSKGHAPVVRRLLDKGMDVEGTDVHGYTPLHIASYEGQASVVYALLAKGADASAVDKWGYTSLSLAIRAGRTAVVSLLLEAGVDPNGREITDNRGEDDVTNVSIPLMEAAGDFKTSRAPIVHLLLRHGANVNAEGSLGCTPLHSASWGSDESLFRLFLDLGGTDVRRPPPPRQGR
jgi:ankyrin repeat protein